MPNNLTDDQLSQMFALPGQANDNAGTTNENVAQTSPQTINLTPEQFGQLLNRQNTESAEERRLAMLAQLGATQGQPQEEEVPEIDLEGLPDPAEDREGFLRGFAERAGHAVSRASELTQQRIASQINAQQRAEGLVSTAWSRFQTAAPDLAKFPALVKIASDEVSAEYQRMGIDPLLALEADMDGFIAKASKRVEGHLKAIRGLGDAEDEPDNSRAMHNFGARNPTNPPRGGKKAAEKEGSFIDEIKSAQKAMGIF